MNFVSQDGTINTNAQYECSSEFKIGQYQYEDIKICQKQQYFATYWRIDFYVKFWKRQKLLQTIRLPKGDYVRCVAINGFLQATLGDKYLKVYFKKRKLISRCKNSSYVDNITITEDYQIIVKKETQYICTSFDEDGERYTCERGPSYPIQLYNFVTKQFTDCGPPIGHNAYEYCPRNNIILMSSGNYKADQISVWSVSQQRVINQIHVQGVLYDYDMKMSYSGEYLFVRDFRLNNLHIFNFGKKITLVRKVSNLKMKIDRNWNIDWIQDHQYFLISAFDQYKIIENKNQIIDCQLKKIPAPQGKQTHQHQDQKNVHNKRLINTKDDHRYKIHAILRKKGNQIDYYSILL